MFKLTISASAALALLPVSAINAQDPARQGQQTRLDTLTIEALPLDNAGEADVIQPATVIGAEELIKKRDTSLGRTLAREPGVSSADFGVGVGRPVVRGLAGPRVRVQENGLGPGDVSTLSVDHAVSIDSASARQIEVLKGPSTLLYGSGSIGGVVNVVTDRIPRSAPTQLTGEVGLAIGDSTLDRSAARLDLTSGLGNFAFNVHANRAESDDYEADDNRLLENSASETDSYGVGTSYSGARGYVGAALASFNSTYGIPGEEAQIDINQDRIDLAGELLDPFSGFERLQLAAAYTDYLHTEGEAGVPEAFFDNQETELRIELNHLPLAGWRGALGVQAFDRKFESFGEEEIFVPPTDTRSAALFVVEERDLGQTWTIQGGLRVEHQNHDASGGNPDRAHTPYSLSLGARKMLGNGYVLAANIGRFQRAPAAEELYSFGPHEATQTFERGELGLDEETANSVDLGLRKTAGRLRGALNLFYTDYEDFILLRSVDAGLNTDGSGTANSDGLADRVNEEGEFEVDGELLLQDYAALDARFYGAEAELAYDLLSGNHRLTASLQGDYVRGELDEDDSNIPRITPGRYGAALEYDHGAWTASTEVLRAASQNRTAPLEDATDGFTDLSAFLGFRLPVGSKNALLYLRGENLLDEEIIRHTSFLRIAQPGRRFTTGINARF